MIKKRVFILFVLFIILCSFFVIAQECEDPGSDLCPGVGSGDTNIEQQVTDVMETHSGSAKSIADVTVNPSKGGVKTATVNGIVSADEDGNIHASDVTNAELDDGSAIQGATGVTLGSDNSISFVQANSFSSETMIGTELNNAKFNSDGTYSIGHAETFSHGDVTITSGSNIIYQDGNLVIEKADSTMMGRDWATNVETLSLKNKTFSVEKAEQVKAGCVVAMNVENSDFDLTKDVNIVSAVGTSYDISDCTGNKISYKSTGNDNEITITQDENKPIYIAKDVELKFEKHNESIDTNGTVIVQTDRDYGVETVIIDEPAATYSVNGLGETIDYSFRAWKEQNTIHIRKNAKQIVDYTCEDCTIIDIPEHKITIKGTIDYQRNLFDENNKILEENIPILATNKGEAQLTMTADMKYVNELLIIKNAPPYITRPNNYITIYEMQKQGSTHRVIDIHEELLEKDTAVPIIKNYKTLYSPATMYFKNKNMHYEKAGFTLRALSPADKEIEQITKDILGIQAALALTSLVFIPLIFRRKKGQVTIFIALGIILVIFFGLALFAFGDIKNIKNQYAFDKNAINEYFNQCLRQTALEGTKLLGAHGTSITPEQPHYPDLKTQYLYYVGKNHVPNLLDQEEKLQQYINQKALNCMIEFKKNWKGVNVTRQQPPQSKVIIRQKDIFAEMEWFFTATKGEQWLTFNKFATEQPIDIRYMNILELANTTVESQIKNDNMFDLDLYYGNNFEIIFFPTKRILNTLILDHDYLSEAEPYKFLFTNKRNNFAG